MKIIKLLIPMIFFIGFFIPSNVKADASFPEIPDELRQPMWNQSTLEWFDKTVVFKASTNNKWYLCKNSHYTPITRSFQNSTNVLTPDLAATTTSRVINGVTITNEWFTDCYIYDGSNWTKTGVQTGYYYTYLPTNASICSWIFSNVDIYYVAANQNFGSNYASIGTIDGSTNGVHLCDASIALDPPIDPDAVTIMDKYIEYNDTVTSGWTYTIESSDACTIDPLGSPGDYPLYCGDNVKILHNFIGQGYSEELSSEGYTPHINVVNVSAPCFNIVNSNYVLLDTEGTNICALANNPIVDQIAPPYTGVINFNTDNIDWGTFNFLKDPAKTLFDALDNIVGWFYDIWRNFLDTMLPNTNTISIYVQELQDTVDAKFAGLDLSAFEDLQDIQTSELPDVTSTIMGQEVTIVNFSLLKDNIDVIRPLLIAGIGLWYLFFNVHQYYKMINDGDMQTEK